MRRAQQTLSNPDVTVGISVGTKCRLIVSAAFPHLSQGRLPGEAGFADPATVPLAEPPIQRHVPGRGSQP